MSWHLASLESLCRSVYSGGTPSTNVDAYYGGDIPWLRTQEVTFGRITNTEIKITEAGLKNSAAKWVPPKSIVVAMYGNTAGRSAIAEIPLTTNQACCNLLVDDSKADYKFVFYSLLLNYEKLKGLSRGAAQNNLNAAQVKAFEIPTPPLYVQQSIGNVLSSYDDLIDNNRRRMALLEDSARQLYREWFVRLRFPGHEHTPIVDGVPQGWERKTLGESVTLNYGKALKAELRVEGDYPVYGSSGIVGTHEKPLVQGPAIVLGRKGNVGSVYWSSKSFFPIDTVYFISAESSSLYLYYVLKHMHFISTDVAVPGLNRDFAYSRTMLRPPETLLRSFHETVESIHAQLDKLDETNQKLRQARDLLLPRLMNGELAV